MVSSKILSKFYFDYVKMGFKNGDFIMLWGNLDGEFQNCNFDLEIFK